MKPRGNSVAQGRATAQRVLDALIDYREKHGFPPSIRELGKQLGVVPRTVHEALIRLEEAGAITSTPRVNRSWVPTRSVAYPEAA